MKTFSLLSIALLISACSKPEDAGGMAGGGVANEINQQDNSDGGGDDTGGGYGSAPLITEVSAVWDTNAEGYAQILVSVSYTDPDDDIDGGKVGVSADMNGVVSPEQWFMIDGSEAIHDAEAGLVDLTLLVDQEDIDPSAAEVTLMLRLKDAALNVSEEYSVTPER